MLVQNNPMMRVLIVLLWFEAIVFGLSVAVMVMLDGTSPAVAGGSVAVAALLAVIAALSVRRTSWGQIVGWVAQAAGIALGFLTPVMWFLGGLFAGLYVASVVLGKRLESGKAAGNGPAA